MTTGTSIRQRVPSVVLVALSILGLVALVLMFVGGSKVGATWDERIHAVMLSTYFDNGWYASPDWLVNGAPGPKLGDWPYYVYAPVAELFTHVVTVLSGQESWGGFSDSQAAYAARHVGTALMALIGVIAAGLTTKLITRSWRWALVTGAFVASVPMWVGHGMFNVKDLPVGTGYTLVTLGFVALLRTSYAMSARLRVLAYVSIVAGVLFSVGTRPASGLPIAMTMFAIAVFLIVLLFRRSTASLLLRPGIRLLDLVVASLASYLALVVIYPKGFINPYVMAHETLAISGKFPVYDAVLTNGTWLQQPVPWFYLPAWFGAQLPVLLLLLLLVFAIWWISAIVSLIRSRGRLTKRRLRTLEICLLVVPVGLQVFLLPLLAIALHSTMYNAVRQFLFVVPAVAILATIGLRGLLGWPLSAKPVLRVIIWALVTVGVALPVVDQVRLFPYGYVYFNEIASLKSIDGNWATDYWRASSQELAQIVPAEGSESCRLIDAKHESQPCADQAPFAPFWHERGINALPGTLGPNEYWLVRENGGDVTAPAGCVLHDQITRPLRGQTITIAQVFRCNSVA